MTFCQVFPKKAAGENSKKTQLKLFLFHSLNKTMCKKLSKAFITDGGLSNEVAKYDEKRIESITLKSTKIGSHFMPSSEKIKETKSCMRARPVHCENRQRLDYDLLTN